MNTVLLVKAKGYNIYWPARIITKEEAPLNVRRKATRGKKIAQFFNSGKLEYAVEPFDSKPFDITLKQSSTQSAFEEAQAYVEGDELDLSLNLEDLHQLENAAPQNIVEAVQDASLDENDRDLNTSYHSLNDENSSPNSPEMGATYSMFGQPPFSVAPPRTNRQRNDSDTSYHPELESDDEDDEPMLSVSATEPQSTSDGVSDTMPYVPRPLKRRKVADKSQWKKNVQSNARLTNQPYTSRSTGKEMEPHNMISPGCDCKFKCSNKISEGERQVIFDEYWALPNPELKTQCMIRRMTQYLPKKKSESTAAKPKPKSWSYRYHLRNTQMEEVEVCQLFFRNTFGYTSDARLRTLRKRLGLQGNTVPANPRGRAHNATSEEALDSMKEHIDSYPRVPSHFCRKESTCLYLHPDLSVKQMHRMYESWLVKRNEDNGTEIKYVGYQTYKNVFKTFNLKFHHPKKDKCKLCSGATNIADAAKATKYKSDVLIPHQKRKKLASEAKEADMTRAANDPTFHALTMDLQAICPCPMLGNALLFYKRHLNCYNFTIYNKAEKQGYCYTWNEVIGRKGTNEVTSSIVHYLKNFVGTDVKHIVFWSDGCGGQNRNWKMTSGMLYLVNTLTVLENLQLIEQKFLEVGHTYMEVDTMHANITNYRSSQNRIVEVPQDWVNVYKETIRDTKNTKKYIVTELTQEKIFNFEPLSGLLIRPKKSDHKPTRRVGWNGVDAMKVIQYQRNCINQFFYKDSFENETFLSATVQKPVELRNGPNFLNATLEKAYNTKFKLDKEKKKDLLDIVKDGIISDVWKEFYERIDVDNQGDAAAVTAEEGIDDHNEREEIEIEAIISETLL